jgi:hypothetical protein
MRKFANLTAVVFAFATIALTVDPTLAAPKPSSMAIPMKMGRPYTCNGASCSHPGNPSCSICCPPGRAAECGNGRCICQ